jgi:hypothetical protein
MPYISSVERIGMEKGRHEELLAGIEMVLVYLFSQNVALCATFCEKLKSSALPEAKCPSRFVTA